MAYLTPDEIPEGDDCRPLFIPANTEWLAFFGGALTELTKKYNWQEWGAVTVDETVAKMQEIIDAWYAGGCSVCYTPGGYRVIRISSTGHIEELDENGDWVAPTGDYYIPPPDAREGGTSEDQICLAAANAVNVLHELYESLSDSWGEDLDENEAMLALIGVFVTVTGFAIAPIAWGIFAFVSFIFTTMFGLLEVLIADLWDAAVSDQIECFLVECASNDAGVVTFDYECFTAKLSSLANDFSLTETQIRLYLQISYLLNFIGGVDGLNLAGATTAITDPDCVCGCEVALQALDYGVVTSLGGTRWRIESTWTGSNYSALINAFGDCWCYENIDYVSGSLSYNDYTVCSGGAPLIGMPNSCCQSENVGMRDDLVVWFMQHPTTPFVIELDALCKTEC